MELLYYQDCWIMGWDEACSHYTGDCVPQWMADCCNCNQPACLKALQEYQDYYDIPGQQDI